MTLPVSFLVYRDVAQLDWLIQFSLIVTWHGPIGYNIPLPTLYVPSGEGLWTVTLYVVYNGYMFGYIFYACVLAHFPPCALQPHLTTESFYFLLTIIIIAALLEYLANGSQ